MPKKRGNNEGALYYIKSKKLWRAVIQDGFKPDGSRNQIAKTSRDKKVVQDWLEEKKAEIKQHGRILDTTTTVSSWAHTWLTTIKAPAMKPNGLANYETITRTWILPHLGKKKVAELKPSDIRLVHRAVLEAGRSTATARKAHNVLSGMLESARIEGIAKRNVADDVLPPRVLAKARGALSTDEAFKVLEAAWAVEDGTRWWIALLAGLRQSERCGARLDSLDLDAGHFGANNEWVPSPTLNVDWALEEITSAHGCGAAVKGVWPCGKKRGGSCPQRQLKVPDGFDYIPLHGRLAFVRPKSGKTRQVPLIPQIAAGLRGYLEATADRPNPYGLIWRKPDGEPYLAGEDGQAWRDILHSAGIITLEQTKEPKDREPGTPDIPTSHWARHTTATVMMELGIDAKIIGDIIGHEQVKTTRGYQHTSSIAARDAATQVGDKFALALTERAENSIPTEQ